MTDTSDRTGAAEEPGAVGPADAEPREPSATHRGHPAPAALCENCGAALAGPFCSRCGQARRSPIVSLRAWSPHVLDHAASLDSRLLRSLRALFFRPGHLTREYVAGRRVRYTTPVQLYLLAAAAFFLVASYRPFLWVETDRPRVRGALPGMAVWNDLSDSKLWQLEREGVSLQLFAERFVDAVNGYLPAFLIGSVALFSLVVFALNRSRERRYVPHAIFALHWTAFYLPVVAAARLLPPEWGVQHVSLPLALLYLTLAQRRVYEQGAGRSFGKAVLLLFSFLVILVVWVISATSMGLLVV